MKKPRREEKIRKWIEGTVKEDQDHIKIFYEGNDDPVALLQKGRKGIFIVQFIQGAL